MKKEKKVPVEGRDIKIYELTVKQIRMLISSTNLSDIEALTRFLPEVSNLSMSDIDDLAPSELRVIWETFSEVNADFLLVIEKMGVMSFLKTRFSTILTRLSSMSSKEDMSTHGITDSDSLKNV